MELNHPHTSGSASHGIQDHRQDTGRFTPDSAMNITPVEISNAI